MDKKNIFELWRENGEKISFIVILDSWNEAKHYAVVEKIEIKNWPFGNAFGQYFFYGKPCKRGLIKNSGTYRWKLKT
ncbi:MAG: hypothetical protein PHT44_02380 [Candidatus Portnoybacteria bacterium]|nr:hypothetical protein [Candidatus Portnoybacteria bacterium]MDD4982388.1 hypothetical protein [Candidatus Portnoybacteria bacterium]